jgi:hypothetical protein
MATTGPPSPTPGKRDPRTLGDDKVPAPTGATDTGAEEPTIRERIAEGIAGRQEVLSEASFAGLETLRGLQTRFEAIEDLTYEKFRKESKGPVYGQVISFPMRALGRALNPWFERTSRANFEANRTAQMGFLAGQMSNVLQQVRLSNPYIDQLAEGEIDRTNKALAAMAKIETAKAQTAAIMQVMGERNELPLDPQEQNKMFTEIFAAINSVPTQADLTKTLIDAESIVRNMPLLESDIERFKPYGLDDAVRAGLAEQKSIRAKRAGKKAEPPDEIELFREYQRMIDNETKLLRMPMILLETKTNIFGDPRESLRLEQQMKDLPVTTSMSQTARALALQRFKEVMRAQWGDKFMQKAVASLRDPEAEEWLEAFNVDESGMLAPSRWGEIRELERVNAQKVLDEMATERFKAGGLLNAPSSQ